MRCHKFQYPCQPSPELHNIDLPEVLVCTCGFYLTFGASSAHRVNVTSPSFIKCGVGNGARHGLNLGKVVLEHKAI